MANEKLKERDIRMFVGFVWNCSAELKLLLATLLFLFSFATLLHFVPFAFSDLPRCTPDISSAFHLAVASPPPPQKFLLPPPSKKTDQVLENGVIKRVLNPYGSAAYSFILMSAYRGGSNTFAVIGLSSKPLHAFGKPRYLCEWIPEMNSSDSVTVSGYKILPDWGYGRVYTVVVVNCSFPAAVGGGAHGGKLVMHASTEGGGDLDFNVTDIIEALVELPWTVNFSIFNSRPKYDFLYCGSSLYGNVSPQRMREWIAYHVKLFGRRSHFVIHDAGGVHREVMEVLKPWIELGYITLHDIRDQERFDGYYHNQFLIVNDCIHRYKFAAKWVFFFDVDEYIYVPPKGSISSVLHSLSNFSQFTIEQMPMSNKLCLSVDAGKASRKWGFEKLVYRDVKKGVRRDRKYAVQPQSVWATGVHMSQNLGGKTSHKTEGVIKYFHYHGSISLRREPCQLLLNTTRLTHNGVPMALDTTLRSIAPSVKLFEQKMIGSRLSRTRQ